MRGVEEHIKIGLIGYGFMGGAHLAAMELMSDVTVVAVASRTRPSADGPVRGNLDLKTGPLPETVRWTAEWQEIVQDPAIDAVDICLPTQLHKSVILSALTHGKHVLCEKPMALTTEECEELLQAAEASDRVLMIAQVLRFTAPYRYAAKFVGSAGREAVRACRLERSTGFPQWSEWLRKRECSGGAVLDLLSHDLDQALQWFGEPETVHAVRSGAVDTVEATLRYRDGLELAVAGGWLEPQAAFRASFAIATDDASLTFASGDKLLLTDGGTTEEVPMPDEDPYAEEIGYFVECCRNGVAPALCPAAESAKAVRLARLLGRSCDEDGRELAWE